MVVRRACREKFSAMEENRRLSDGWRELVSTMVRSVDLLVLDADATFAGAKGDFVAENLT